MTSNFRLDQSSEAAYVSKWLLCPVLTYEAALYQVRPLIHLDHYRELRTPAPILARVPF